MAMAALQAFCDLALPRSCAGCGAGRVALCALCDVALRDALAAAGWRHDYSSFELFRAVGNGWQRPAPRWPDGVRVRPLTQGQEDALHALIYTDAG